MTAGRGISPLAPISGDWAYGSDTACHLSCGLPLFEVRWEHLCLFTCLWPLLGHHGYFPGLVWWDLRRMDQNQNVMKKGWFFCVTKEAPRPMTHCTLHGMWCHLLMWAANAALFLSPLVMYDHVCWALVVFADTPACAVHVSWWCSRYELVHVELLSIAKTLPYVLIEDVFLCNCTQYFII